MIDSSLPLTVHEYDEWGDPHAKQVFEYILSYDPYRNIRNQKYPSLLVTGAMLDTTVPYWQPLKYVAKLRTTLADSSHILLLMDENLGHFGDGGRDSRIQETAFDFAFLFKELFGDAAEAML